MCLSFALWKLGPKETHKDPCLFLWWSQDLYGTNTEGLKSTPISGGADIYFYKLQKERTHAYGKEEQVNY